MPASISHPIRSNNPITIVIIVCFYYFPSSPWQTHPLSYSIYYLQKQREEKTPAFAFNNLLGLTRNHAEAPKTGSGTINFQFCDSVTRSRVPGWVRSAPRHWRVKHCLGYVYVCWCEQSSDKRDGLPEAFRCWHERKIKSGNERVKLGTEEESKEGKRHERKLKKSEGGGERVK